MNTEKVEIKKIPTQWDVSLACMFVTLGVSVGLVTVVVMAATLLNW